MEIQMEMEMQMDMEMQMGKIEELWTKAIPGSRSMCMTLSWLWNL